MIHINPMHPLIGLCFVTWYLVKQTSIAFDALWLWDYASIAAGIVGLVGMAYVQYPIVSRIFFRADNPLGPLVYRSLSFGVAVAITSLGYGLLAEEEGYIRTPEKLAPPKARLFEKVSSVDELDEATLKKYTEGERA